MRKRRTQPQRRGFILLGVILIVAVVTATVTLTLRQSTDGLQQAGGLRASELAGNALQHGLDRALEQLQTTDTATLLSPPLDGGGNSLWDIFDRQNPSDGWLRCGGAPCRLQYPQQPGPYQNQVQVRVGLRVGQTTQAPPGENAVSAYGYVVELQLSAEVTGFAQAAEEQVAVGIQVPQTSSYAK